jgi:hypothetical protein
VRNLCYNEGNKTRPEVREHLQAPSQQHLIRRYAGMSSLYPEAAQAVKRCTRCGLEKPLDQFGFAYQKARGKSYRRAHCRACDVLKAKAYRKTAAGKLSRFREHQNRYHHEKEWMSALKEKLVCVHCGENDYVALDFHHLDPSQKDYNIPQMWGLGLNRMKKEISKCSCLCANCHRKFHAGRFVLPPDTPNLATLVASIPDERPKRGRHHRD